MNCYFLTFFLEYDLYFPIYTPYQNNLHFHYNTLCVKLNYVHIGIHICRVLGISVNKNEKHSLNPHNS